MGYKRTRPYVGRTPDGTGAHYIVIEADERPTNIQVVANGTVTAYTVDWTNQNILYDAAASAAVNVGPTAEQDRYTDPASAAWTQVFDQTATQGSVDVPVFAIRINITTGTGSLSYHITQA